MKKKKRQTKIYWDNNVEQDLVEYIKNINIWSKSQADKFFRERLYDKFYMLSENILKTYNNRYGFNRIEEEFENLIYDCVAEIYSKLDYYDWTKGAKAFSYFGTVAKHYLIRRATKQTSIESTKTNLEDYSEIEFEKNYHFIEEDNAHVIVEKEESEKILKEKILCLKEVLKENEFTEIEKILLKHFYYYIKIVKI